MVFVGSAERRVERLQLVGIHLANIGVDGRVDEAPLDMPSMEWDLVGFDARVARSRQVADSALLTTK